MAWPPPLPPNNRTNATPLVDAHAQDHNQIVDALTELVARAPLGLVVRPVNVIADQTGIGATNTDLTGFTSTLTAVAGRWYRLSWLLCTQVSAQCTNAIRASLDGALIALGSATPATSWYATFGGSLVFSCGANPAGAPSVNPGARVIKLTGSVSPGTMTILNASAVNGRMTIEDIGAVALTP